MKEFVVKGIEIPREALKYETVGALFEDCTTKNRDSPWYAMPPFQQWTTFGEAAGRVKLLARALLSELGLKKGDFIGLCMMNSAPWVLTDFAATSTGIIPVGLHLNNSPQATGYIIKETEMKTIFTFSRLLPLFLGMPLGLKTVVCADPIPPEMTGLAKKSNINLLQFADLLQSGAKVPANLELTPPGPDDIWSVLYTSGTTGMPKGAVYTHRQILYHAAAESVQGKRDGAYTDTTDSHLSYMPLAHVFERYYQIKFVATGGRVGFFSGDPNKIFEDLATLQASHFITVPAVLAAIRARAMSGLKEMPEVAQKAFWADFERVKDAILKDGIANSGLPVQMPTVSPVWNQFTEKLRQSFGGKLKQISTGSAPLSVELKDFIKIVVGVRVVEGYGLTEHVICTATHPNDADAGNVGKPYAGMEIKLVPNESGQNALFVRSGGLMEKYYKRTKAESKIDEDGWFNTGDAGTIDEKERISIVGRLDHMFKLPNGEYIVPDALELDIKNSNFIKEAFVHNEDGTGILVALVEPEPLAIQGFARAKALKLDDSSHDHPIIRTLLKAEAERCQKEAGVREWEVIRDVKVMPEGSLTGCWTPTRKLNRKLVLQKYSQILTELSRGVLQGGRVEPKTALEEEIMQAWKTVLNLEEQPGYDVSFWDLGGKSLYLVQLAGKLKEICDREIPVEELLRRATIAEQAEWLEE